MTDTATPQTAYPSPALAGGLKPWPGLKTLGFALLLGVIALCGAVLELRFAGLEVEEIQVGDTPVTLYRPSSSGPLPPVIVAHGFAGSRQMMDQISVSLARQGFLVASVDLPGHGRHPGRLSPDVADLRGTTAQLVTALEVVADAITARADTVGPVSYVGHSMATDIVVRAAQSREDVGAVVAISMYSPAVTQAHPKALLVLSGAAEGHLRQAGLNAVRQIAPKAEEGVTVTQGEVTRRTAVAPLVGHVGVLYAPQSLEEITIWLRDTVDAGQKAPLDHSGWVAGLLLAALVLLVWPLCAALPKREDAPSAPLSWRRFALAAIAPIPVALIIAALPTLGIAGLAGFGTLAAIFAAWGLVQLAILRKAGQRLGTFDPLGALAYLGCALLFALALDRYGAAFVPTGDRALVLAGLLLGAVPLMLADTMLLQGASLLRRILARMALLVGLAAAMGLAPLQLGLAFSTLPVLVLFFLVYGTMGCWIAARRGASGVAFGKAVVLAWAIAASTPLFAAL